LDRQPAAELIKGTLAAWHEALTFSRRFVETQDAPRFRAAFATLCARVRRWPSPAEFLDVLPRIDTVALKEKRLNKTPCKENSVAKREIEKTCELLGIKLSSSTKP
jgi:hypothetical protein